MLLIVGLGILINSSLSGSGVLGTGSSFSANDLLSATNVQRYEDNESTLNLNPSLAAAAQAKADDMVRYDYWAHDSPAGRTPWSFITANGYQYQRAGENLAYGFADAQLVINGWMNSSEHRANILNSRYSDVGFGVASSRDFIGQGPATVVVAEYAQPADGTATAAGVGSASSTAVPPAGAPSKNILGAESSAQPISRVQLLTGSRTQWPLLAAIALSGAAMLVFVLRHGYRLHRWLTRGEIFVTQHPYLDIAIVFIITAGCVLTRVSGTVL